MPGVTFAIPVFGNVHRSDGGYSGSLGLGILPHLHDV